VAHEMTFYVMTCRPLHNAGYAHAAFYWSKSWIFITSHRLYWFHWGWFCRKL